MKEKFLALEHKDESFDGLFRKNANGVGDIAVTADGKIGFADYNGQTLCYINGSSGQKAIYPLADVAFPEKVEYVAMDLDGTSIVSEEFWIEIIRITVSELLGREISFTEEDVPFVSGHTTVEHLDYALHKYGDANGEYKNATEIYHKISHAELEKALKGKSNKIRPTEGLKEFLLELKKRGIKIGLVSSGLFYKAIPEIESAFARMEMGDPKEFYDSVIMGGVEKGTGKYGSLGELVAKPHPWLYKELVVNGLNCTENDRVLVIEDSASGVVSGRLAGYAVVGLTTGNIQASGLAELCTAQADSLADILKMI